MGNLYYILRGFIGEGELGFLYISPFDVILSKENVLQPDILYISRENSSIITPDNVKGPPDLVIEITSPATRNRDREVKRKIYARYGVREYWLVDQEEQSIEVMSLSEKGFKTIRVYQKGEKLQSPLFPGLSLNLKESF